MIKKILSLLTSLERKRLYMLIGVMVISAIIEVVGIASVLPFLSLITNPNLINDNKYLNWLYTTMGFQSTNRYLIFVGIIVLVIMIISNALSFLTRWGLTRFSWMRSYSVSRRLLLNYVYQPYLFFLNQNTSLLGKNILSEVGTVIKGVVDPLLSIMARTIVAVFIFSMLVALKPLLAISLVFVLGGTYILTYRLIRRRLGVKGHRRYKANAKRFRILNEGFGEIKLLKLMGYENYMIKRYSKPAAEFARLHVSTAMMGYIPKYITEVLAFGGIIIIVLYLLATTSGLDEFLPIIGIYAFSTYRLLPSIQSIFSGMATVRFNTHALDVLFKDMHSFNMTDDVDRVRVTTSLPFKKELELRNITFTYPGTNKPFIKDLNIKVSANTSVAFVGTTGAGKTTLANIILGLLSPDGGKIIVDGIEVDDGNLQSWQRNLGYIPQDIYLQDDKISRNIAFGIPEKKIDMNTVIKAAKIANIHDFVMEELPDKYDTIVGEKAIRLSGGQKQRIGIARAVYHDPEVLVLDEATSALDGATEQEVFKAIENVARTKTLIMIAHRLTTIQECDVIYVLENGNIVGCGKYDELMKNNKSFRKIAKIR